MPLSSGAAELPLPQEFPFVLCAQVDAQLTGRISQKEERVTKVEMVVGGRSPQRPLTALYALCEPLE